MEVGGLGETADGRRNESDGRRSVVKACLLRNRAATWLLCLLLGTLVTTRAPGLGQRLQIQVGIGGLLPATPVTITTPDQGERGDGQGQN